MTGKREHGFILKERGPTALASNMEVTFTFSADGYFPFANQTFSVLDYFLLVNQTIARVPNIPHTGIITQCTGGTCRNTNLTIILEYKCNTVDTFAIVHALLDRVRRLCETPR